MYTSIHSTFFQNSPKLETTQDPSNGENLFVAHPYNGMLLSNKKGTSSCCNTDASQNNDAEGKRPDKINQAALPDAPENANSLPVSVCGYE